MRFLGADALALDLPTQWRERVKPDQAVTLGVRPEHVLGEQHGPCAVDLSVRAIEPLGSHTLVVGEVAGAPFTAQVGAYTKYQPDERVRLALDPERLHLFDALSGAAL